MILPTVKLNEENKLTRDNYCFLFENGEEKLSVCKKIDEPTIFEGSSSLIKDALIYLIEGNFDYFRFKASSSLSVVIKEELNVFFDYTYVDEDSTLIIPHHLKNALFAGGCFWCMALPYYEMKGVKKVISGYAGGKTVNPKYLDVKKQLTGHKETGLIYYDDREISYEDLLRAYFASIDPFDKDGQFIDRGSSYTTAVFTSSLEEKAVFNKIKKEYEDNFKKEVVVEILDSTIFYKAEEEHQDFHLKNPLKMEEELRISGRYKKGEN